MQRCRVLSQGGQIGQMTQLDSQQLDKDNDNYKGCDLNM